MKIIYKIDLESKDIFLYQMQHANFQFLMPSGTVQPISMLSPLTQEHSSKLSFGKDHWTVECDILCCMLEKNIIKESSVSKYFSDFFR